MKMTKLAAVLFAAICILLTTGCSEDQKAEKLSADVPAEQETVVHFNTTDLEGNPVDDSIFDGYDLIIVNIFEDWCRFTPRELRALQKISEEYTGKVLVLGVVGEGADREAVKKMLAEAGVTYPVVNYNDDFKTVDSLGYRPESAVLGKNGVLFKITEEDLLVPQTFLIKADIQAYNNGEYEEEKKSQSYSDYFSKLVLASKSEEYLTELAEMYSRGAVQTNGEFSGDLTYAGWKYLVDRMLGKQR